MAAHFAREGVKAQSTISSAFDPCRSSHSSFVKVKADIAESSAMKVAGAPVKNRIYATSIMKHPDMLGY